MASDDRDRGRFRDEERDRNRGMFGYEGEGYMRGRDDYDDYARRGYGRDAGYRTGFTGGYGGDRDYMTRGYQDLESGADRGWNIGRDNDRGEGMMRRESNRGRGPKNYQRSDERIREDICERLALDEYVDATDLEVTVENAVVKLEGTVNERHATRMAEDIAESVRGVKDVQNNIRVNR